MTMNYYMSHMVAYEGGREYLFDRVFAEMDKMHIEPITINGLVDNDFDALDIGDRYIGLDGITTVYVSVLEKTDFNKARRVRKVRIPWNATEWTIRKKIKEAVEAM